MTRRKDVTPNPSHPIKAMNKLDTKIKIIMLIMKANSICINRE